MKHVRSRIKEELFALGVVLVVLVAFPAGIFGYQAWRTASAGVKIVEIVARAPEQGGFSPDRLSLRVGETVRLRISSPDVVHGLTIPGLGVNVNDIYPGKVVEVDVTPDKPGRYAFACTRWCSVDHWRMRGVIEVTGGSPPVIATTEPPLFQQLGIDLDAMPHEAHATPNATPSISVGAALNVALPQDLTDPATRRTLAPAGAFDNLRADPANAALSDADVWNLVAWAWMKDVSPTALARAATLYARDCAACHGPDGKGKGPAGLNLPGMQKMDPAMPSGPADFTDPAHMLAASDVLLQGKLLRGGMGTGMPEFGSLYTDEEQWAMIAYLRTFLFAK
ncbi:MAG: c-type cytochrome [Anaerolineae bacterium]|nr:c-type cytochrome [Anaerolineae bacterium]